MEKLIKSLCKNVRPEKNFTKDAVFLMSDYIQRFIESLISNKTHISLFSIKERMESIVHPFQIPYIEKDIDSSFYKYYKNGPSNNPSINYVKKWLKYQSVDTFCYTDLLYISTCVDYLCLELCELSGKIANENKKTRVTSDHIYDAIANDEALSFTFRFSKSRKFSRK
jgi:hypothetical protein